MNALARIDTLQAELAQIATLETAKDIADKADALRVFYRKAQDFEAEIAFAEIRINAERRLGELLLEYSAAGLIRPGKPAGDPASVEARVTRVAIGIDERLADRARKYATWPRETFETRLAERRAAIQRGDKRVSIFLFNTDDKAVRRAARETELAAKQRALPERCYGVILADPEWRFDPWSRESGMDRSADNHYPTSETADIAARDVRKIAADDCVLFLWATVPMMPDALEVMRAWGFTYRSQLVWDKERIGTGYWFRNQHELMLVGTHGNLPAPAPGTQWPSVLRAPAGAHSAKPERALEMIEAYFPTLPKIELNRRGPPRPGWDAWGNEAELEAA